jgi:hypothetical protein
MGRRRFDHLFAELSVAVGRHLRRYELWLAVHEAGVDPECITHPELLHLCDRVLPAFLKGEGLTLPPRTARRLRRELERYDPSVPTPYERFAALG